MRLTPSQNILLINIKPEDRAGIDQILADHGVPVENQASAKPEFGRRMLRYWARLYEKHGIPVYPVVLFSFDAPRTRQQDRFAVSFPGFTPLTNFSVIFMGRLAPYQRV